MSEQNDEKQQRGIQSVEVAAELLEALIGFGGAVALKDFAAAVGMSSARAFPYLVSLVRAGLVHKDEASGLYGPGLLSQELGILGLHYLNPLDEAEVVVRELAAASGHAVGLSVWGALGPTVVRIEESRYSLYSEIRLGSVMSLVNSSIGRVFSAWMPQAIVDAALAQEGVRAAGNSLSAAERKRFIEGLTTIRSQGMEVRQNAPMPGLSAMSAPVFGLSGDMAFALTVFDETGAMDLALDGQTAQELRRRAGELSMRLGHIGP